MKRSSHKGVFMCVLCICPCVHVGGHTFFYVEAHHEIGAYEES